MGIFNERSSLPAKAQPCIIRGWLHKAGEHNSAFKRRYFVLTADSLAYYKDEGDNLAAGSIVIAGADVEAVLKTQVHLNSRQLDGAPTNRTFYITAANESERDEWVRALHAAAESRVHMPSMDSSELRSMAADARAVSASGAMFTVRVPSYSSPPRQAILFRVETRDERDGRVFTAHQRYSEFRALHGALLPLVLSLAPAFPVPKLVFHTEARR